MITKTRYLERRIASLRALELEIARLTDYANKVTADVAFGYHKAIHGLQTTYDKAEAMLDELRAVHDSAWEGSDPTLGVEDAWNDLRDAVIAAISTTYCEANRRPGTRHATGGEYQIQRVGRIAPRGSCY